MPWFLATHLIWTQGHFVHVRRLENTERKKERVREELNDRGRIHSAQFEGRLEKEAISHSERAMNERGRATLQGPPLTPTAHCAVVRINADILKLGPSFGESCMKGQRMYHFCSAK